MKKTILVLMIIISLLVLVGCNVGNSILPEEVQETNEISEDIPEELPEQEKQHIITVKEEMKGKEVSMGTLCSSMEECASFCPKNQDKCMAYCEDHFEDNELCQSMRKQKEGCTTYEECEVYCVDNPEDISCVHFFEDQEKFEVPVLGSPIDLNDKITKDWGLWPFCVHGGEHPEGHGGIDFELKPNAKIYASGDGMIEVITTPEEDPHGHGSHGLFIQHELGVSGYSGLTNVQVKEGDEVKKGQYIADAFESFPNEYYIHFEVNNYIDEKLVCPLEYFDEEFQAELNKMLEESTYPEKGVENALCICDWLPYKETMASIDTSNEPKTPR